MARKRTREFLFLKDVVEIHGKPCAVFGRVRLALDTDLECHEVLRIEPEDAARLGQLLDKVKGEKGL